MYEHRDTKDHSFREYSKRQALKLEQANRDYPPMSKNQFKLSSNVPKFSDTQPIVQVQKAKKIAQLQLQNKLNTISNIIQIKILTKLDLAFTMIRVADDPHLSAYSLQHTIQTTATCFFHRIQKVYNLHMARNLVVLLLQMKLRSLRSGSENSRREMLRLNSRVDYDQSDYLTKNSKEQSVMLQKVNRVLRRKKEASQREFMSYMTQMQQLLANHEHILRKN